MDISAYTDTITTYISQYSLKIVAAILIFVIGKWVVKKITAVSKRLMEKAKVDQRKSVKESRRKDFIVAP